MAGIMLGIFCSGAVGIVLGSVFDAIGSLGKVEKGEEVKAHN